MTDPLLKWRDEFPIVNRSTYLVSHSLGAMPRGVYDSLHEYADTWATRGVRAWGEGWLDLNFQISDKIGALMGAPPGSVIIQQNASLANAILLSGLDFSDTRRSKVVVTDMIFPSDNYALSSGILPAHMEIHMVKSRDRITVPLDELLEAIDERTRLVSLSHVLFRSSYIMPAKAIVARAHEVGAQVLLNGYHTVGVIPVDVTDLKVDFYIGGVLKWMCGGPGGVFLYVRPDLLKTVTPKITGWFAHPRPFAFDVKAMTYREDIWRLMNGTPGVPSLHAIRPGVDIIAEIGIEAIRDKNRRQTALLIERAQAAGYTIRSPLNPDERGGMIVIDMPHSYAISRELIARDFVVDFRDSAGIRIGAHFYNTDDEIRAVMDAIADIIETGAWQRHAGERVFVT